MLAAEKETIFPPFKPSTLEMWEKEGSFKKTFNPHALGQDERYPFSKYLFDWGSIEMNCHLEKLAETSRKSATKRERS